MPANSRRFQLVLGVVCLLLSLSPLANAKSSSLTVIGNAYAGGDSAAMTLSAGPFSAFSAAPGGQSVLGGGAVGVPMTLSWFVNPFSGSCCTEVNVGGNVTDTLYGSIIFTSTFTIPGSALVTGTFRAPATLTGEVQAFQDLTLGTGIITPGPLMATLMFSGKGTATFTGFNAGNDTFIITFANTNFKDKGTLTVAPEPASLLLFGTGLAGLAFTLRRRRNLVHPVR